MPPFPPITTNATLTAINQPTGTEDYDRDETDAGPRWSGAMRGIYQEKRNRVTTAEGSEFVITRSLILPIECDADREEIVSFESDDDTPGQSRTGIVRGVERNVMAGHPLQSVRLTLEDA